MDTKHTAVTRTEPTSGDQTTRAICVREQTIEIVNFAGSMMYEPAAALIIREGAFHFHLNVTANFLRELALHAVEAAMQLDTAKKQDQS